MQQIKEVNGILFVSDRKDTCGNMIWEVYFKEFLNPEESSNGAALRIAERRAKAVGMRKTKNGLAYTCQTCDFYALVNRIKEELKK